MSEINFDEIRFDERGLVPAIVQNAETREVLMLAYMNQESLARTIETKQTWFWSRSRQELWHKGATSGNTQDVVSLALDCDGDAIVVLVKPAGPACHTGSVSCFNASSSLLVVETLDGSPLKKHPTPFAADTSSPSGGMLITPTIISSSISSAINTP